METTPLPANGSHRAKIVPILVVCLFVVAASPVHAQDVFFGIGLGLGDLGTATLETEVPPPMRALTATASLGIGDDSFAVAFGANLGLLVWMFGATDNFLQGLYLTGFLSFGEDVDHSLGAVLSVGLTRYTDSALSSISHIINTTTSTEPLRDPYGLLGLYVKLPGMGRVWIAGGVAHITPLKILAPMLVTEFLIELVL